MRVENTRVSLALPAKADERKAHHLLGRRDSKMAHGRQVTGIVENLTRGFFSCGDVGWTFHPLTRAVAEAAHSECAKLKPVEGAACTAAAWHDSNKRVT